MDPNKAISARRKELGLQLQDFAKTAGMGEDAYRDVEWRADEAYTAVPLGNLRRVCNTLGLNLLSLFGIECGYCSGQEPIPSVDQTPRNRVIADRRAELGLSQDQLGDRIGFETIAIERMERDQEYLEGWPIELIVELAAILEVPSQALLRAFCEKCEGKETSGTSKGTQSV